jgi:hypothetical protein
MRYLTSDRPGTWIDGCEHVIVTTQLRVTNRDNGTRIGRCKHVTVAMRLLVTNRDNKTDRGIASRLLVRMYEAPLVQQQLNRLLAGALTCAR